MAISIKTNVCLTLSVIGTVMFIAFQTMVFLCVNWSTALQFTGPGAACAVPMVEHRLAAARTQARSRASTSHGVRRAAAVEEAF
jgi:hypothetical protein